MNAEIDRLHAEIADLKRSRNEAVKSAGRVILRQKEELEKFRNGYQGACYACEPVGILNQKLQAEIEQLKAQNAMMQASRSQEVERLRALLEWIAVNYPETKARIDAALGENND